MQAPISLNRLNLIIQLSFQSKVSQLINLDFHRFSSLSSLRPLGFSRASGIPSLLQLSVSRSFWKHLVSLSSPGLAMLQQSLISPIKHFPELNLHETQKVSASIMPKSFAKSSLSLYSNFLTCEYILAFTSVDSKQYRKICSQVYLSGKSSIILFRQQTPCLFHQFWRNSPRFPIPNSGQCRSISSLRSAIGDSSRLVVKQQSQLQRGSGHFEYFLSGLLTQARSQSSQVGQYPCTPKEQLSQKELPVPAVEPSRQAFASLPAEGARPRQGEYRVAVRPNRVALES